MQLQSLVGLMVLVALNGCASHGEPKFIPIVNDYGRATIRAPSQYVGDAFMSINKVQLIVATRDDFSDKQLGAVASVEQGCQEMAKTVHPHLFVAGVTDALKGGAIGALAYGIGANAAYSESANRLNDYPIFGLSFTGVSAGLHGPFNENVSRTDTFRRCGSTLMGMFPEAKVRVIVKSPR